MDAISLTDDTNTCPTVSSAHTITLRYRVYPKQCAIQLKPLHDKTNHFSIIWTKDKGASKTSFSTIETDRNCNLQFVILRACANCTYGRFDDSIG